MGYALLKEKGHRGAKFSCPAKTAIARAASRWNRREKDILTLGCTSGQTLPGQYYDQETKLHYNYHRYYDPSVGRYITSDPIGLAGGLNTYAYAINNPLRFTDRFGLISDCSFYQDRCEEVPGSEYYCDVAPFVCENWPDDPWDWDGCVRRCLQDKDCPADPCGGADLSCIAKIHGECWYECARR